MNFEESIIIPLKLYQKCKLDKHDEMINLLTDDTIPTDSKMKLFHQAQTRKHHRGKVGKVSSLSPSNKNANSSDYGDHIIMSLPVADRPHIKAILDFFQNHPSALSWNDKNEVIVGGSVVHGSNIVDIFRFFAKTLPITRSDDEPTGSRLVYETLLSLGVPSTWIKRKPVSKSTSRRRRQPSPDVEIESDDRVAVTPKRKKAKKKKSTVGIGAEDTPTKRKKSVAEDTPKRLRARSPYGYTPQGIEAGTPYEDEHWTIYE